MARPQIIDWVENNFGVTECNFYDTIRDGAYGAALGSALTGQFWLTGGLALVGGAAQLTAEMAGCNKPRLPDTEGDCWTAADGVPGLLQFLENRPCAGGPDDWASTSLMALEVTEVEAFPREDDGTIASKVTFIDANGITQVRIYDHRCAKAAKYRIANCTDPVVPIPPHKPGEPIADPVTTTTDDGCTWTMQATDSYVDQSGQWHTYYTVTADNDACGGPFAYWSSSNGPQWVAPKPPGPDGPEPPVPPPDHKPEPTPCPDPCAPCPDPSPCPDPCPDPCPEIPDPISLPASTYQLTGVCEDVAQGQPQPIRQWSIPSTRYEQALAARPGRRPHRHQSADTSVRATLLAAEFQGKDQDNRHRSHSMDPVEVSVCRHQSDLVGREWDPCRFHPTNTDPVRTYLDRLKLPCRE